MAGSQVSAGSLAPDDDDECHHRKTADPVSRGGGWGEGNNRYRQRRKKVKVEMYNNERRNAIYI